jgi:RNase P/RNase MRP subunit p29
MIVGEQASVEAFGKCFEGRIVDETKHMIVVRTQEGRVMIPKSIASISMDDVIVDGKTIEKRVWDTAGVSKNGREHRN